MSDKEKSWLGALCTAIFFTVVTGLYLWVWLFDGLDMENPWIDPLGTMLFGTFCVLSWAILFVKLPEEIRAQLTPVITGAGYVLGFVWLIVAAMMVFLPLFHQAQHWLKFGEIPHRDLYWLFADVSCAETNWQARGWVGMDTCRDPSMFTTGWIGFDKITSFILDLHTAIVFIGGSIILWMLGIWFLNELENERP
ncbi:MULTISPECIES: hypothetical protein [unclassified Roseovarius]|uniref:hypothetical protein n=1 Tax=unclassified Roseovarius TaxID=2614913 RepID=UPI00273EC84D|nr:hypothetical protein [Roseovarius sp. MMSF_3350]